MLRAALVLALAGCFVSEVAVSEQDLGVSGLWTAPNTKAMPRPPGALLTANEVVFRRPQLAEPRPGFEVGADYAAEGSARIEQMFPYAGGFVVIDEDDNILVGGAAAISDATFTKPYIRTQETRGNLYLTSSDVLRKITSLSDTTSQRLGVMQVMCAALAITGSTALADQTTVAVRVVIRRTDANGLVTRSAPSSRAIASNTSGSAKDLNVVVYLHAFGDVQATDVVEVYRSYAVPFGYAPSDELYLAYEYEITSSDISTGTITLTIDTVEGDLGKALYTNSNRESLDRANRRPPLAKDIALFQGSMFLANLTYPHTATLRVTEGDGSSIDMSGSATGVGYRETTGTRTQSSNVISGLADLTGLEVGMILQGDTNWGGTNHVRITAVGSPTASDVTMSEVWSGSTDGAPVTVQFADSIRIKASGEDQYYPARFVLEACLSVQGRLSGVLNFRAVGSGLYTTYALGDALEYDDSSAVFGKRRSYVIEGIDPSAPSFEVFATHGDEYEPAVPTPDQANGLASEQDVFPNGITWSKNSEPEHFMIGSGHRRLVGNSTDVLRIVSTKDALWILKASGDRVYRLSGFSERNRWRIDQDIDARLLHPGLATVADDSVYAWMDEGAMRIDDGGGVVLSEQIKDLTRVIQTILDEGQCNRAFAIANQKDGEVMFGLPLDIDAQGTANNQIGQVLVHNLSTRAWSRWFADDLDWTSGCYDPVTRKIVLGRSDATTIYTERLPNPNDPHEPYDCDEETSMTISSITDNSVQFSASFPYDVGALIRQSGNHAVVVSVDASDTVTVDDASALTAAACIVYEAYESRLEWFPKVAPGPSLVKLFQEVVTHWDDTYGVYAWDVELSNVINPGTTETLSYTRTLRRATGVRRHDHPALVPMSVAKASELYPSLVIQQAGSRWRISGLTIRSKAISERLAR